MQLKLNKPRKIHAWGYSFMITLPIPWLNHHEIGRGDSVDFSIAENGDLIVRPLKGNDNEKTTAEIGE